jgi:uncharacterized protein YbjT (DUF2867 family)
MKTAAPTNPVLVIGATGRHGNTGEYLVRRLREEDRSVRVLARKLGERTEQLAELGAEIVVGDLHDRQSLVPALTDVDLAYFTYPIAAGVISAAANYAAAVREVGRRPRTVVMSMGPAHPDHPSDLGKDQWLAEQVMEWAGLELLILRVTALFHQNIAVLHAHSIRRDGVIRNSFGPNSASWISGRDAAELGLAGLLHPERFDGPVTYPLGPEGFNHAEIAEILTELLGRPIRFEPITREEWRQDLVELSGLEDAGVVNPSMAQHISSVGYTIAQNGPTLPADPEGLRRLIAREPLRLRDYLQANLDLLQPATGDGAHIAPAAPQ